MSIIKCPECGGKVSTTTDVCIHCGYNYGNVTDFTLEYPPIINRKAYPRWLITICIGFLLIIVTAVILFFVFDVNNYILGKRAGNKGDYKLALKSYEETQVPWKNQAITVTKQLMYNKATEMITAERWSDAVDLLTGLKYQNSDELLAICSRYKGMTDKSDFAFLASLQESITRRMEINAKENSDHRTLVTTELAYVEKYKNEEFYDSEIKSLANRYIDGLNTQLNSLDANWISDSQVGWQKGLVERYEVLFELYDKYDFMKDDKDFEGTYIAQLDEQKNLLAAYQSVEADIGNQFKTIEWSYKNDYLSCSFKNNTEYTYSTIFEFTFYDKNSTIIDNRSVSIENIKPEDSFIVSVYIAYPSKVDSWNFGNYYSDIG